MSDPGARHDSTANVLTDPEIPQRKTYLVGHPVSHSIAPLFHSTIFQALNLPWTYTLFDASSLSTFLPHMHAPDFIGAAITIPHKVAILPHLDSLTPEARAIGAVNTVFVRPDPDDAAQERFHGTNTDYIGVKDGVLKNFPVEGAAVRGKAALVLGAGGAARSAVYAARECLGAAQVYIVNRDEEEVSTMLSGFDAVKFEADARYVATVAEVAELQAPAVMILTVPDHEPVSLEEQRVRAIMEAFLAKGSGVVVDMCYVPEPWTALAKIARDAQWKVVLGTDVMIYQAIDQDLLWTERTAEEMPTEKVAKLVRDFAAGK
ncbi:MAG: hypothetical protein M1814_006050 [Vezdaea aestivalis]|nr:MAG: hypothetical protein M1814_006050 [Vezdaea aestivalis]